MNNEISTVDGLRAMADFLEARPDLVKELDIRVINTWIYNEADFKRVAKAMGVCEKKYVSSTFWLRKEFGPIALEVNTSRDNVCKRKVVKRTVSKVVPDPKVVADAPMVEVTEEVEDIEWDCDEPLLAVTDG